MSERFSFLDKTMKDVQVNNSILVKEEFNKWKKLHDEKKLSYKDIIEEYLDSISTMFYQHYKPVEVPTADSFDDSIPASEVKDTISRYEIAKELEYKSYTSFNLYNEVFKLLAIEYIKEELADREVTGSQAENFYDTQVSTLDDHDSKDATLVFHSLVKLMPMVKEALKAFKK